MKPTVSIILPTYNRAQLLERAIKSVLQQTYRDFEVIIIDDGSTDNTIDVIKKFKEKDNRIRYVKHKKNKGPAAARNTGIKKARGQYVAFQDSDDEWLPTKLEKQMNVFENESYENIGVVYTGFYKLLRNQKVYIPPKHIKVKRGYIHIELLKHNFIGTPVVLAKKECFKKAGLFDTHLLYLEDWDMWIRMSRYCLFEFIDEALVMSYYTPSGVNEKPIVTQIETLKRFMKKYYADFKSHPRILGLLSYDIWKAMLMSEWLKSESNYYLKLAISTNKYFILRAFFDLLVSLARRSVKP